MRRPRLILIPLAGLLLALGAWFLIRDTGEPKYQGRPVAFWFREFCQTAGVLRPSARTRFRQASNAFHSMGTNAVPFLLKAAMTTGKERPDRRALLELMSGLPPSFSAPRYVSPEDARRRAAQLLGKVRPPAGMVLPRLRHALNDPNSPPFEWALSVLQTVDGGSEPLVPYYAAGLRATNSQTRLVVTRFLEGFGAKAAPAVPGLLDILRMTPRTNALFKAAASALGAIGSNAAPALPLLSKACAEETNWDQRCTFAEILWRIGPGESEALGLLAGALTNQQNFSDQVRFAAWHLGPLGTNAVAAIPALLQAADRTNLETYAFAEVISCLDKLGVPSSLPLAKLRARLKIETGIHRLYVAAWILGRAPADPEAQALLLNEITNRSQWQRSSIAWLGLAGTNAAGAAPLLLAEFDSTACFTWPVIPRTLEKLGVSAKPLLPKLREKLTSGDDAARVQAAGTILEIEPGDESARLALIAVIQAKSKPELWAMHFLGEAGPAASNALPVLRRELKSRDPEVRNAAANAIERIEASPPIGGNKP